MIRVALASALALGVVVPSAAWSQSASDIPVEIIVPYPPGSGSDIVARLIATDLSPLIDQPVIVVNDAGGSGLIAAQRVEAADPDGNTLLLTTSNHVLLPTMQSGLDFDVVGDFAAVTQVAAAPLLIAANTDFAGKGIQDLIAMARADPGAINYAVPGIGTVPHLAIELLSNMTDIEMTAVPYRGGAEAMNDVVAGIAAFYLGTYASARPFLEANQAVPMALTSAERPDFLSDIPTIAEQGVEGYAVDYWIGIMAPAGADPARVTQLHDALVEVVTSPAVSEALLSQGYEVKTSTPEEFQAYLAEELQLWSEVAEQAGVEPQ